MKKIQKRQASKTQEQSPVQQVKLGKHKKTENTVPESPIKKPKLQKNSPYSTKPLKAKTGKKSNPTNLGHKGVTAKKLTFKGRARNDPKKEEKIEDWNKFKKEKKELKMRRIKAKTKDNFDRIQEAKKMGEKVRLKTLKDHERIIIINKIHGLLKGHYAKFVLAHDTARIVQWLLKYCSKILVHQISQELIPVTINMLQSKYSVYCVRRLLKYGENDIRTSVIDQMKGHVVKLVTHTVSGPVVEFAVTTYATPLQKQLLVQEFYGVLYKKFKDPKVKHIRDVYKDDKSMKSATLDACKINVKKVINKSLLDSGVVQTVLSQYLHECSTEDRAEIISELAPHIVVISNSRDGSKVAMNCIWHGTTKDRKVIMKSLKEHLIELSKHEFGHNTVITLLDSVDDTVLLHKIILSEILSHAKDLALSEWGRKVLLWLVAPAHLVIFHPQFITELTEGRESSSSKKSVETRRQEILSYSVNILLNLIIEDAKFWLSTGSLAIEMVAILKAGSGDTLNEAISKVVETVTEINWKIQDGDNNIFGIEHPGIHMALKKLACYDKIASEQGKPVFGNCLVNGLTDEVLNHWLKINRCCFLLVAVFENSHEQVQKRLQNKLKPHLKLLNSQTTTGAKILVKQL